MIINLNRGKASTTMDVVTISTNVTSHSSNLDGTLSGVYFDFEGEAIGNIDMPIRGTIKLKRSEIVELYHAMTVKEAHCESKK